MPQSAVTRAALNRILISLAMTAMGAIVSGRAFSLYPQSLPAPAAAAEETPAETVPETLPVPATPATASEATSSEAAEVSAPETEPEPVIPDPGPDVYNFRYLFPEDADPEDPLQSYGGKAFRDLFERDTDWQTSVFRYSTQRPENVAAALGVDRSQIMGKYNITDDTHDIDDPSTWDIGKWKNINVSVTDGNGAARPVSSNVKEILAMASVYCWYNGIEDYDTFYSYAKKLWNASHSSSASIGTVYYDEEDCITAEQVRKAIGKGNGVHKAAPADPEAQASGAGTGAEAQAAAGGDISDGASPSDAMAQDGSSGITDPAQEESASGTDLSGQSSFGDMAADMAARAASQAAAPETEAPAGNMDADMAAQAAAAQAEGQTASQETAAQAEEQAASQETAAQAEGQAASPETAAQAEGQAASQDTAADTAAPESSQGTDPGMSADHASLAADETAAADPSAETAIDAGGTAEETEASSVDPEVRKFMACPGHVDLTVKAVIYGLDGKQNLFTVDPVGSKKKNFNEQWQGWTEEAMTAARILAASDWYENYGLSVSLFSKTSPLSASEIESYLELLPEDLSEDRKKLAETALGSIGRIPYYFGGKASSPEFDKNHFGTLVAPDYKGRVFRGLDCSGWFAWTWWHTFGKPLGESGTGGLIHLGHEIRRKDLNTGDILVRAGGEETIGHVLMFFRWDEEGNAICIHETGGVTNNVVMTVQTDTGMSCRNLLD